MKTLFAFLAVLMMTAGMVSAQKIEFETLEINYGDIAKGANGVREFKFKNTSDVPLIIEGAQGSCGCTVPDYPKEPIMPGETKSVRVKYDTQRTGPFTKYVTLTTNAKDNTSIRLTIRGNVNPEPDAVPTKEKSLMPVK
jgi:Protein of unknown function (DUF1573)